MHAFKPADPQHAIEPAEEFDQLQRSSYQALHAVDLTDAAWKQACLPLRLGGQGFSLVSPSLHGAVAASLMDAAPARLRSAPYISARNLPILGSAFSGTRRFFFVSQPRAPLREYVRRLHSNPFVTDLGSFDPAILADTPVNLQNHLNRVLQEARAKEFWADDLWMEVPSPTCHPADATRRRIRGLAFRHSGAAAFLHAHPTSATKVSDANWSIMLRRHLGLRVYDDSMPLLCHHCQQPLDVYGDHAADLCPTEFGRIHRHNSIRNVVAYHVFRAAGLDYQFEVRNLVPGSDIIPADVLVNPPAPPAGSPEPPIACDFVIASLFKSSSVAKATQVAGGAAIQAHQRKVKEFRNSLSRRLVTPSMNPSQDPGFRFQPLAFDSLGVASPDTAKFLEELIPRIAARYHNTHATICTRIYQRISCTLRSSVAMAILSRAPLHVSDVDHPVRS